MDRPPFSKLSGHNRLDGFLREFFIGYLGYARIDNDPDEKNPQSPEAWRLVIPVDASRPIAITYQAGLASMERRRVSRLYIERVVPHRDREGIRSVEPALYGFTDGLRLVFFSADPARNRDDRFDLSESTWRFRVTEGKVARLHRNRLQFQTRLGRKRPVVEFLFEASALSADDGFKRYVHVARQELMRAVLEDRRALGAVVYHLLESPDTRETGKTEFVSKDHRLKKTLEELHFDIGVRLGDAVAAAVDTLLLRYIMVRFLEAYHPEAMEGLLKSEEVLKRGKGGRKVATTKQMMSFGGEVGPASFSETELELARMFNDALGVDVSKAKAKSKGADQRQPDLFAFGDEKAVANIVLEEEGKRKSRLGGDFYLADLGRAANAVEAHLLSNPSSRGAKLIQDFLGRTGAPEMAQWDFRYEDLRPQTLQDYYESSLGTAVELSFNDGKKKWEIGVGRSQRQRKEMGAFYTDPRLCRLMVERTVRPVFESRLKAVRQMIGAKDLPSAKREFTSLVNLSVCDPTMGSAPFLRSAFDYLSEQYLPLCRVLIEAKTTLPAFFDDVSKHYPFLAAKGGRMDEDGVGRWEWHILRRMLYGVDLDLKAVCIACQTFALSALKYLKQGERFPSFFNLNLKLGNALVSPLRVADRVDLAKKHGRTISNLIQLRRKAVSLPNSEKAYDELVKLLKEIEFLKNPLLRVLVEERLAPLLDDFTEDLRPFCWEIEFPEIFFDDEGTLKEIPGFDVVLGNPPWEAIKYNNTEFLSALGLDPRKADLDRLCTSNKFIKHGYDRYRERIERVKLVATNFYVHQQGGRDRNYWRLATELSWTLLREFGSLGLVLPSGIIGDEGATALKRMIFDEGIMDTLISFEKENEVFPGAQGFTIVSARKNDHTRVVSHVEGLRSVDDLNTVSAAIEISLELVQRMSPLTLTIPSITVPTDLQVLTKMYEYPTLSAIVGDSWTFTPYTAEIHMGHDRKNGRISNAKTAIPLLTGEAISDFEIRFQGRYCLWVDPKKFQLPTAAREYRVVWRNVVGTTDPRRMVVSLCPKGFAVGHSLNYVLPNEPLEVRVFQVGVLSSFVIEWRARQISRNNNMVHFVLKQLPVPRLKPGDKLFDKIVSLTGALLAESNELRALETELGVRRLSDPRTRARAKAEIDACVATLFGLSEPEYAHVLQRFEGVPSSVRDEAMARFHDTGR